MRQAAQVQGKDITDVTPHLQVRFINTSLSSCLSYTVIAFAPILFFSISQVVSGSSNAASLLPDAVYLCGLELRGASWDTQLNALREVVCQQMCSMPLVCVEAQVKSINAAWSTSCREGNKKHCSCTQVTDTSPVTEPEFPLYQCPIYLDGDLESGNSGRTDVNVITSVALQTKVHPMLCSLRWVRLVSVL